MEICFEMNPFLNESTIVMLIIYIFFSILSRIEN